MALHLHGILDLPQVDLDAMDELLTPERLADLLAVVRAQPRVHAQVVVPLDVLRTGVPVCTACAEQIHPHLCWPGPGAGHEGASHGCAGDLAPGGADLEDPDLADRDVTTTPWDQIAKAGSHPPTWAAPPSAATGRARAPDPQTDRHRAPQSPQSREAPPGPEPPGRGLVGELIGSHPMFLTPGHARELILLPGTTLHRLLVDPADGRLVVRTIASYRPDTDMRRQILSADLYSRSPASRLTGRSLEIDHVIPHGAPGGETTESNLAALDRRTHQAKTIGTWKIAIGARRDVTVTTLLDQRRRTRVHDYSQYLRTTHPEDLEDRRDLANRALYAHEAEQTRRQPLGRSRPDLRDDDWVSLTHTDTASGRTRLGPHPQTPSLRDVLGIPDDVHEDVPGEDTRS